MMPTPIMGRLSLLFGVTGLVGCMSIIPSLAPSVEAEEGSSVAFPFESKFVDVLGSRMHYVEVGEGAPAALADKTDPGK